MRIECATLCDSASVREGLLNVLGAGISSVALSSFPAPLPLTFAFRVVLETRELRPRYTVQLDLLKAPQETEQGRVEVVFEVAPDAPQPPEEAAIAAPIPVPFSVTGPGRYLVRATFNNQTLGNFPLRVSSAGGPPAEQPLPEGVELTP